MTERTHNIAVGLTVLVALTLLAGLIVLFTGLPWFLQRGYDIKIAADKTHDVHPGDGTFIASSWVPKFEAGNVRLVLGGHAHVYERLVRNGIHYVIAGAGSSIIYGLGVRQAESKAFWAIPGYPIFELYEDRIHLTAYAHSGEILDDVDLAVG